MIARLALCITISSLMGCSSVVHTLPAGDARTADTGTYDTPGELLRRAQRDCASGQRVILIGAGRITASDRLRLLAQIVGNHPSCEVVTASTNLTAPAWTYVSWRPDRQETQTLPGEPRPRPITVQELQGDTRRNTVRGRAQFAGCAPGQTWLQVFPPKSSARHQRRVMAGLPPMAGCQKVAAVQDQLPRPQGRLSIVLGVPNMRYDAGSPQAKIPAAKVTVRQRKASFKPLSPSVTFLNGPYTTIKRGGRVGKRGRIWEHMPTRRPIIVAMFASWCEACLKNKELRYVQRLKQAAQMNNIRFLNIADGTGKIRAEVRKLSGHVKASQFVFPIYVIRDRLENLRQRVKPFEVGLPLFFVMHGRRVQGVRFGGLDDDVISDLIDAAKASPLPTDQRNHRLAQILENRRVALEEEARALVDIGEIRPLADPPITPSTPPLEEVELQPELIPAPPKPPVVVSAPPKVEPKVTKPVVEVAPPKPVTTPEVPSPPMSTRHKWGWGLIGSAAALFGGATATWLIGEKYVEPFRKTNEQGVIFARQAAAPEAESFGNAMRVTTIALGVLGVAAAATGIAFLTIKTSGEGTITSQEEGAVITLVPTGDGAALGVTF